MNTLLQPGNVHAYGLLRAKLVGGVSLGGGGADSAAFGLVGEAMVSSGGAGCDDNARKCGAGFAAARSFAVGVEVMDD